MNRDTQSILLVLLGGAILRISYGEVYLRYVKEGLQPFRLISGAVLVLLGVAMTTATARGWAGCCFSLYWPSSWWRWFRHRAAGGRLLSDPAPDIVLRR